MRSHLAARSTRLVLAVTTTAALTAGLTACDPGDDTAAAGQSSAQSSSSTTGGTVAPAESSPGTPAETTNSTGSTGTTTGDSNSSGGSGGSSEQSDADDRPAWERGERCSTGVLDFSVTAGEGDYLVVTAKAQNHVACWLDHKAPLVIFNSSERTTPYPSELMKLTPPDAIELSAGTTDAAYAVLIPNTTQAEDVVDVVAAEIALGEGDSEPTYIDLPGAYKVSEASITDWYPTPEAATPDAN